MSTTITRPNGKVYRRRKPPEAHCFDTYEGSTGVVVTRTHDIEEAAQIAANLLSEFDLSATDGDLVWWRLVPWDVGYGFDNSWIQDEAHGSPWERKRAAK